MSPPGACRPASSPSMSPPGTCRPASSPSMSQLACPASRPPLIAPLDPLGEKSDLGVQDGFLAEPDGGGAPGGGVGRPRRVPTLHGLPQDQPRRQELEIGGDRRRMEVGGRRAGSSSEEDGGGKRTEMGGGRAAASRAPPRAALIDSKKGNLSSLGNGFAQRPAHVISHYGYGIGRNEFQLPFGARGLLQSVRRASTATAGQPKLDVEEDQSEDQKQSKRKKEASPEAWEG